MNITCKYKPFGLGKLEINLLMGVTETLVHREEVILVKSPW